MKHFLPILIGAVLAAGMSKSQSAPAIATPQQQQQSSASEGSTSFHGDGNSVTRVGDCVMLSSPDVSFSGSGC